MNKHNNFDVIIVGGSYSGLAAGMALGRALRKVLIIDSGNPCNRQTPHSHNFLTQDGNTPYRIAALAKQQVMMYKTVTFLNGLVINGAPTKNGFEVQLETGGSFTTNKLIFATGIKEVMPDIPGFSDCWGISVIHCPYCHGFEVRKQKTGILGNGEYGYGFSSLISNWTDDLTLYTNGKSTLTPEQTQKLYRHDIKIVEDDIEQLKHNDGYIQQIIFRNGNKQPATALYTRLPFIQHSTVPELLGCQLSTDGYIKIDPAQKTSVPGIYACGDNASRSRSLANAVAMGTTAAMMVNKELIEEAF